MQYYMPFDPTDQTDQNRRGIRPIALRTAALENGQRNQDSQYQGYGESGFSDK
jgi:hypothetical protein